MNKTLCFQLIYYGSGWRNNLKSVLAGLLLYYTLAICSGILILINEKIVLPSLDIKSIADLHRNSETILDTYGVMWGTIIVTILGPFIEEISFRLPLNPNPVTVAISASTLIFFLSGPIWYFDDSYKVRIVFCIFICLLSYIALLKLAKNYNFEKIRYIMYYISALVFALLHLWNFNTIIYSLLFLYPIYILPQFFMGLILGLIRIKNGFFWSILLHILINGSVVWPKLIVND